MVFFRKITSFLLTLLLLASHTGLAFNVHYCGGEIAAITPMLLTQSKTACADEAERPMDCCKDKVVKAEKNHEVITKVFVFQFDAVFVAEPELYFEYAQPVLHRQESQLHYYCDANAPPLFKLYQQYIFYA